MFKRLLLGSAFALALWFPAFAAPVEVQDKINSELEYCSRAIPQDGFLRKLGRPDLYVVDYGKINCDGSRLIFCGSAGCLTQVFVLRPSGQYELILNTNVRDLKFANIDGKPAMTLTLHGSACGLVGADVCIKTVGFGSTAP
jgi:hypothetical protein